VDVLKQLQEKHAHATQTAKRLHEDLGRMMANQTAVDFQDWPVFARGQFSLALQDFRYTEKKCTRLQIAIDEVSEIV